MLRGKAELNKIPHLTQHVVPLRLFTFFFQNAQHAEPVVRQTLPLSSLQHHLPAPTVLAPRKDPFHFPSLELWQFWPSSQQHTGSLLFSGICQSSRKPPFSLCIPLPQTHTDASKPRTQEAR